MNYAEWLAGKVCRNCSRGRKKIENSSWREGGEATFGDYLHRREGERNKALSTWSGVFGSRSPEKRIAAWNNKKASTKLRKVKSSEHCSATCPRSPHDTKVVLLSGDADFHGSPAACVRPPTPKIQTKLQETPLHQCWRQWLR